MRSVGEVVREEAGEGRGLPLGVEDVRRDDDVRVGGAGANRRGLAAAREIDARAADASGRATELFVRLER